MLRRPYLAACHKQRWCRGDDVATTPARSCDESMDEGRRVTYAITGTSRCAPISCGAGKLADAIPSDWLCRKLGPPPGSPAGGHTARSSISSRARRDCPESSRIVVSDSAVGSSVGGTLTPSAFAALRLITSSNLVGSRNGRSAGFEPLSTLRCRRPPASWRPWPTR
jgi:hypothetical protein